MAPDRDPQLNPDDPKPEGQGAEPPKPLLEASASTSPEAPGHAARPDAEALAHFAEKPFKPGEPWEEWMTGGGCMALALQVKPESYYVLLTVYEDPSIPETEKEDSWIGLYSPDGQPAFSPEAMFRGGATDCQQEAELLAAKIRGLLTEHANELQEGHLPDPVIASLKAELVGEARGWKSPMLMEPLPPTTAALPSDVKVSEFSAQNRYQPGGEWGETMTGGGCTALTLQTTSGYHVLLTAYVEDFSPKSPEQDSWMGLCDPEGLNIWEPSPMFEGTAQECAREGEAVIAFIQGLEDGEGNLTVTNEDLAVKLDALLEERGWNIPDHHHAQDVQGDSPEATRTPTSAQVEGILAMGPAELARGDWRIILNVLEEARKKLEAETGGRQSWMLPAIDIAKDHAAEPAVTREAETGVGMTKDQLMTIHDALLTAVDRYDCMGAFDEDPDEDGSMRPEADQVEAALNLTSGMLSPQEVEDANKRLGERE